MMNSENRLRSMSRLGAVSLLSVALAVGVFSAPATAAPADSSAVASSAVASSNTPRPGLTSYSPLGYVALGDSFTSGQGAPPYSDEICKRSRYKSYPIITSVLSPYRLIANKACSGANVDAVTAQLAGVSPSTKLVTLTVGGIDAGSNEVVAACAPVALNPALPSTECLYQLSLSEGRLADLAVKLPGLYAGIATALPNARIAVVGYPRLFESASLPADDPRKPLVEAVNGGIDGLNGVIEGSVDAAGVDRVQYVDVTGEFAGHGIGSRVPYIAFNPNDLAAPANFHPNGLGNAAGYYRALANDGLLRR